MAHRSLQGARVAFVASCLVGLGWALGSSRVEAETISFFARGRDAKGGASAAPRETKVAWEASQTAVVICDMWDRHWCEGATRRVGEMAPVMNDVVRAARKKGMLIVHCPSDTMDYYKDHPGRKLAQSAPRVETKIPLERWCHLDPGKEGKLPIDDSDGGCDDTPAVLSKRAWTRQHPAIAIEEGDAITDSAEAFYLMKQRGIENVIVMGVHTNMCVLGRPFSIRQMVNQGQNVVLMRDMTDAMYNPAKEPKVSHLRGTELVIEHIERHWCPTITSSVFTGKEAFRFSEDRRPHVAMIVDDNLYESDKTLRGYAQRELIEQRDWYVSFVDGRAEGGFRGMEALRTADALVVYARRKPLRAEEKQAIEQYLRAGKPVIGLRTASHAFSVRGNPPAGLVNFAELDATVWGGSYKNHTADGCAIEVDGAARSHRLLAGIDLATAWTSRGSLYRCQPLVKPANVLLWGTRDAEREPVAWVVQGKPRIFYTSLGAQADFEDPRFVRMLSNVLEWAVERPVPQPATR